MKIENYIQSNVYGLPGVSQKRDFDENWKVRITSKYYVDGIIDTEVEYDSGDKEDGEEITYTIHKYINGVRKKTTSLSENHSNKIPTELTSIKMNEFYRESAEIGFRKNRMIIPIGIPTDPLRLTE